MSSPLKRNFLSERDGLLKQKLGTVLDVILSEFDKLGYKQYIKLDAANYGVPQFREICIDWKPMMKMYFYQSQHIFRCTRIRNINGKLLEV